MRFFNSGSKGSIQTLLMALLLACGLWYMVVGRDQVETQMEVSLGYRGLPSSLVVTSGLRNSVTVRLRGSAELLRVLQNRGASYTVDLSGIVQGDNSVRINIDRAAEYNAFDIVSISPNRLRIRADALFTKEVGLTPRLAELDAASQARDLEVTGVRVEPEKIQLTGPRGYVDRVSEMTVDYDPNRNPEVGDYRIPVQLPIPEQVTSDAQIAELIYSVRQASGTVMVTRDVVILRKEEPAGLPVLDENRRTAFEYEPKTVIVVLNIPKSKMLSQSQGDPDYMDQVMVTASEPGYNLDVMNIPVAVTLPEGASVVWKSTDFVTARRVQRQQAVSEGLSGLVRAEHGGGNAEPAVQAGPGGDKAEGTAGTESAGGAEHAGALDSGAESIPEEGSGLSAPDAGQESLASGRDAPQGAAGAGGGGDGVPGTAGPGDAEPLSAGPDGPDERQPFDESPDEEQGEPQTDAAENTVPGQGPAGVSHGMVDAGAGIPGQIPADSFVFRTPEESSAPGHPAAGF
ncbi:MAG: hypothetical protein J5855_07245 [Mailhella sp.]|nr:hypothetical protein [Mailhella sp.]